MSYPSWNVTPFAKGAMGNDALEIVLGGKRLIGIVASRVAYTPIGVIRQGLNFGLLCIGPDGQFARVNGAYVESLDFELVKEKLSRRYSNTVSDRLRDSPINTRSPVQVTWRKRRTNALAWDHL